jgi:HAE1 family hydrophobic/amphiphilic exporter-1
MPDVEIPFVSIQTVYPGAGPKEVETLITNRVEDAVSTVSQIKRLESYSLDGASIVVVEFELDKDIDVANQEVKDKIDQIANELPDNAHDPIIQKVDFAAMPIVDVVLYGADSRELYRLADEELKDRFSQIDGVAKVDILGGQEREIRVTFDNRLVFENMISLPQLIQTLATENVNLPGGYFQRDDQEYTVRVQGEYDAVEAMRDLRVPTPFGLKRLSRVADVRDAGKDVRQRAVYFNADKNIREGNVVKLGVVKAPDGNVVEVADAIKDELPDIEATLPSGVKLDVVNDKSGFTRATFEDTMSNVILGVVFTSIVLLFFLADLRSTIIVALTMPGSIISTFLLLQIADLTLNMMTLMGLSVSVGVLVANSVVVLENIFRHKTMGKDNKSAANTGTSEIAVAVIGATLTNLVVFLPIANMSSIVGMFLRELALAASFATIFSLLYSFTLTPMLASIILPERQKPNKLRERLFSMFASWDDAYRRALAWTLKGKLVAWSIIGGAFVVFIVAVVVYGPRLGTEFMPRSDDGKIKIEVELPVGHNLEATAATIREIESRLKEDEDLEQIVVSLGKISDLNTGANVARMDVTMIDAKERDRELGEIIQDFVERLASVPNARVTVDYGSDMGAGGAPIQFSLLGQDVEKLEELKEVAVEKIKNTPGLVNFDNSSRAGKPEITVSPKRELLAETGMSVQMLALTVRAAVEGVESTQYREEGDEYDVTITLEDESVDSPEEIGSIALVAPNGMPYRLSQLANVEFTSGYTKILHRDKYTSIQFTGSPAQGTPLGDVTSEVERRFKSIDLPPGYRFAWGGNVEMMNEMIADMMFAFALAVVLTYMLLAALLESFLQPLFILLTLPLALIGVLAALYHTNVALGISSMMAIIMLIGIVVNNAILIMDYVNILIREKGMSAKEALIEGAPTKLKPIIMSTAAIILGMLPLALGIGAAGSEMRMPLGVVSIGGLIVSAILTLFVIPAFYYVSSSKKESKA